MSKSYRFVVTGRVQGVFFRQSAREQASHAGLRGWVRNRTDGAVEGRVSGDHAAALDGFRTWLQRGPDRAQVQELTWEACEDHLEPGFQVRG